MFGKILATLVILATALAAIIAVGLNRSKVPPQVIYVSEEELQVDATADEPEAPRRMTLAELQKPMVEIRRAGYCSVPTVGRPEADALPECSMRPLPR